MNGNLTRKLYWQLIKSLHYLYGNGSWSGSEISHTLLTLFYKTDHLVFLSLVLLVIKMQFVSITLFNHITCNWYIGPPHKACKIIQRKVPKLHHDFIFHTKFPLSLRRCSLHAVNILPLPTFSLYDVQLLVMLLLFSWDINVHVLHTVDFCQQRNGLLLWDTYFPHSFHPWFLFFLLCSDPWMVRVRS